MSDPTAIEISFDPTIQRMKGITVHGGLSFDVPFISELDVNLWQGGCEQGLVLPTLIKHMLSLYPWGLYSDTRCLMNVGSTRPCSQPPGARALPGWPEQVEPRGCPS